MSFTSLFMAEEETRDKEEIKQELDDLEFQPNVPHERKHEGNR